MRFTNYAAWRIILACFLSVVVFYAVFSVAYFIMARHQILDLILTPDIVSTQTFSVLILRLIMSTLFASLPAHIMVKVVLPKKSIKSLLE
jgi:hypothetical protein